MLPASLAVAHFKQTALPVLQMHYALQVVRELANVLLDTFSILNGCANLAMRLA